MDNKWRTIFRFFYIHCNIVAMLIICYNVDWIIFLCHCDIENELERNKSYIQSNFTFTTQERNTVLYLEPNISSQLTVITLLLQHYGWNRLAIVSDNDYENVKMASSIRAMLEKNAPSEVLLNFIIKPGDNSLAILVNIMKDIKFRAVVLLSQPVVTSTLLKKAKLNGLIHQECTWIMGVMQETEVSEHNNFSMELPGEIIEIKFTGRHHAFLSFDYFMEDSIAIFRKALKYPEKNNFSSQRLIDYVICHNDEVEQFGKYLGK